MILISVSFVCHSIKLQLKLPKTHFLSQECNSKTTIVSSPASSKCAIGMKSQQSADELFSPVLILPGLGNSSSDYRKLRDMLVLRGHRMVAIAPVQRWQWGLNAKGFFMPDYWRCKLKPNAVLDWYFDRVDTAVSEIMETCDDTSRINVLGHSAGGWLARAYLAERAPSYLRVSTLLTLGTPHVAPPTGSVDQTRGLLKYIEENCDISKVVSRLVCVAGGGTTGKPLGEGSVLEFLAFLSYAAVCGRGNVDGDGVTPVDAACCEDGESVYCESCDHSMLTSHTWYGSPQMFCNWARYLT